MRVLTKCTLFSECISPATPFGRSLSSCLKEVLINNGDWRASMHTHKLASVDLFLLGKINLGSCMRYFFVGLLLPPYTRNKCTGQNYLANYNCNKIDQYRGNTSSHMLHLIENIGVRVVSQLSLDHHMPISS